MRSLKINAVERGLKRFGKLLKQLPKDEQREHKHWLALAQDRVKEIKNDQR